MTGAPNRTGASILTINPGSSSLKVALYLNARTLTRTVDAQVERIGEASGLLQVRDADGVTLHETEGAFADHAAALDATLEWLGRRDPAPSFTAAGVRVVYGGAANRAPRAITGALVSELEQMVALDPDHTPQALSVIETVRRRYPDLPQVACFDTAFHRTLPRVAQMHALPHRFFDAGLIRYGFHGLSCEYILDDLRIIDAPRARGRVIVAHLGNGASMTAVRDGQSVDTTMGFTPAGGLMMGTRSGDLGPGVLLYLQRATGMTGADLNALVNRESGLVGVSGRSADMRDLLATEASDPRAADAVALFCHLARRFLGGLAATLGGLDTLVFTAGIGEHAAPVRARICAGLEFMGIQLDAGRNERHAAIISSDASAVVVRVMKTDEELMIARHVRNLLGRNDVTSELPAPLVR